MPSSLALRPRNTANGCLGARSFAAQHLAGFGIGGQPPLINAVAVVLHHKLGRSRVQLDQDIAPRVEGNEALGEAVIQLLADAGIQGRLNLVHGVDRRKP